jgi:hypothetical protein
VMSFVLYSEDVLCCSGFLLRVLRCLVAWSTGILFASAWRTSVAASSNTGVARVC